MENLAVLLIDGEIDASYSHARLIKFAFLLIVGDFSRGGFALFSVHRSIICIIDHEKAFI